MSTDIPMSKAFGMWEEVMKNIIIITVFFIALFLFIIGDSNNEPLEIQNNGGTMCMACIGLE